MDNYDYVIVYIYIYYILYIYLLGIQIDVTQFMVSYINIYIYILHLLLDEESFGYTLDIGLPNPVFQWYIEGLGWNPLLNM